MMRYCFLLLLFVITINAHAQSDTAKAILDRKLVWADFTGKVDQTSDFAAMTYWYVNYSYQYRWSPQSDTVSVTFTIVPKFGNRSWVKKNIKSDDLLTHEQGHYDLAMICAEILREKFAGYTFFKKDYAQKIDSIFQSTLQLVKQMELQYDTETNHMLNKDEQAKWNENIAKLQEKIPPVKRKE